MFLSSANIVFSWYWLIISTFLSTSWCIYPVSALYCIIRLVYRELVTVRLFFLSGIFIFVCILNIIDM